MLRPLNPRFLNALACDGDNAGYWMIRQAKNELNTEKNLSLGVLMLLETYGSFIAQLYQDKAPMDYDRKGAESWHIRFRLSDPPFDHLRINSTPFEGIIDVCVLNKPLLSICMFSRPQNWQFMLQWLWESGDQREIARSIPQLDTRRMRILVNGNDGTEEGDKEDADGLAGSCEEDDGDLSIHAARRALAMGSTGEGLHKMLLAFHIFKPLLQWDKSSTWNDGIGHEKWHISLLVSPFRSLRLQPGDLKGVVDIYAFDKLDQSLPVKNGPQSWQAFLEWLWDYGNWRHIAKAEYDASRPRLNANLKPQSKRPHTQKPLLHQVLRTASFKTQKGARLVQKQQENIIEAAALAVDNKDGMATKRLALQPADPNGQVESGRVNPTKADDKAKLLRGCWSSHDKLDVLDHNL